SIFGLLAALVVSCAGEADPILAPHIALSHNLPHDPIGVQRVPVAPIHSPALSLAHLNAVPSVTVKHHGTVAVAHQGPFSVAHHAPVAVSKAIVGHSIPVARVAYSNVAQVPHANIGVVHHAPAVKHYAAPAVSVAHAAPAVSVAHAAPVTYSQSQYHSQDELGQYAFGYNAGNSARDEVRDAYGNVRGSFSYVDSYGKLQTQHYIADDYGFRVVGTDLPVAHGHRYKRALGTYPASTGPLATIAHIAPAIHAPLVHNVAPVVHKAAPVVHSVAPVVHKIAHAPVVHKVAPVVHNVAPAVPVVHQVAPAVHRVASAVHTPAVVHGAALPIGYSGYSFHTGPAINSYRSYHPW
ncbi:hypothetical protein SK128_016383, partial [Halocaridina rubra]